ncbi:MAG: hypothetical protein H6659_14915 [Ardenticatenaceae bacterium]|nr:hypothetical protein [Ardenticatenaceae bacterium]MCB8986661.1 hypothetical protein [Ardenticatenaceae bacterium]
MTDGKKVFTRAPLWVFWLAWIGLLLAIVWLYAPALKFGLIWDDPEWFGRVVGQSWGELIRPSATFQFYRPGTMVYNRLFLAANGRLQIMALHWLQIVWHLLNVTAVFAISCKMGFSSWAAYAAAFLFGVYPFSHQAVAWAAPQQPLVLALQNTAWLLYLGGRNPAAGRPNRRWAWLASLLVFFMALTVQEGTAPYGLLPLIFEIVLRVQSASWAVVRRSWRHPLREGWIRPLAYLVLAAGFMVVWGLVPRESGITRLGFEPSTLAFFLQGFVYPAAWFGRSMQMSADTWLVVFLLLLGCLWGLGVWRRRGLLSLTGFLWAILGLTPAIIGLPYSYVQYSQRLFYYAAPGVAWMLVCAFWPTAAVRRRPVSSVLGLLILGIIAVGGVRQVAGFQALYKVGTRHLQSAVQVMAGENGRFLFVNFPDRYVPKTPPYPLGYWGVTLAPVVVDLADFASLTTGASTVTQSRAVPALDEAVRASGPFQVDMRGVSAYPEEIYALAAEGYDVYVSRYEADGRFKLEHAGLLQKQASAPCAIAQFGEAICLQGVNIREEETSWQLQLLWSATAAPQDFSTVFVHVGRVGQPPVVQTDGDAWRGLLPPRYWQTGDLIIDERTIPKPADRVEGATLQIGLYDRLTGERLPAQTAVGRPLPDDTYTQELAP